jgi:hypothetical protein
LIRVIVSKSFSKKLLRLWLLCFNDSSDNRS